MTDLHTRACEIAKRRGIREMGPTFGWPSEAASRTSVHTPLPLSSFVPPCPPVLSPRRSSLHTSMRNRSCASTVATLPRDLLSPRRVWVVREDLWTGPSAQPELARQPESPCQCRVQRTTADDRHGLLSSAAYLQRTQEEELTAVPATGQTPGRRVDREQSLLSHASMSAGRRSRSCVPGLD